MLNPALTELVAVATDDGAPLDDGSPMGTALALTAANSTPGECLLWHATDSFTTLPFLLCRLTSEFLSSEPLVAIRDTPGSDPGPVQGHPAEDWAEW